MKKTNLLIGLAVGVMAVTAVSVAYAASGNYSAWKTSIGDRGGRAASVVTEQNFDQFTNMHQLMADGKYDEAQKVRTDLGLGQGDGNGAGGCGMHGANGQGRSGSMHRGGAARGADFVDANNNGTCDNAEQAAQ